MAFISKFSFSQTKNETTGKTVRMIIGFPPGQATDSVARLLADKLRGITGDSYIVDNRPGQGGSLAMGVLAKSPPNGTVMMLVHMSAFAANPHLYQSVPYNALKDFEAVGLVGDLPFVLVCNPDLPFKNFNGLLNKAWLNGYSAIARITISLWEGGLISSQ